MLIYFQVGSLDCSGWAIWRPDWWLRAWRRWSWRRSRISRRKGRGRRTAAATRRSWRRSRRRKINIRQSDGTDPLICRDVKKRVNKERQNNSASDCFYNQILNNYFYRMEKKQRERRQWRMTVLRLVPIKLNKNSTRLFKLEGILFFVKIDRSVNLYFYLCQDIWLSKIWILNNPHSEVSP